MACVELGPFFPFLAAGVAIARIGSNVAVVVESELVDSASVFIKNSDTKVGLSIGTGVQVQAAEHIAVRGEVLWDEYGSSSLDGIKTFTDPDLTIYSDAHVKGIDIDSTIARLSLIWDF